ncbi:MAG: hypothetical protein H8D47_02220 [Planctomycetes bacterium]|nr:hypothetical protein [Planctomycetota bacterium]MBL7106284.1 hypothetical protein [Phycisphaerae bacterium]
MKYITAFLASLFMFAAIWFVLGFTFSVVMPVSWSNIIIKMGPVVTNIPYLAAMVLGGGVATYTFRASLHAKSFKLYKNKDSNEQD